MLVKLSLSGVTFMDSSGIAVLFRAKRQMIQRMKKLAFLRELLQNALDATKLHLIARSTRQVGGANSAHEKTVSASDKM